MKKTSDLEEFLRSKAEPHARPQVQPEIDWEGRKKQWLKNIADLHALIRKWLAPLQREGVLSLQTKRIKLQEEQVGSYEADALWIFVGKHEVALVPMGTFIVGAQGRIDIRSTTAARTIIFNDGKWSLIERTPKLKFLPFNESSFRDALSEVME